jgi:hypothetical protein
VSAADQYRGLRDAVLDVVEHLHQRARGAREAITHNGGLVGLLDLERSNAEERVADELLTVVMEFPREMPEDDADG